MALSTPAPHDRHAEERPHDHATQQGTVDDRRPPPSQDKMVRVDPAAAEERALLRILAGDGTPLLLATAACLAQGGTFAVFLALTRQFLPHDLQYLGMSAADLCSVAHCRVVAFMAHDRMAFGGALVAAGVLHTYLVLFPLRRGEDWAWWLLTVSGAAGFLSFLAYLGDGYLDTWRAAATGLLLPVFVTGLTRARRLVRGPRALQVAGRLPNLATRDGPGRACLLAGAAGTAIAGLVIFGVGVTDVFVPEDLAFMGMSAEQLHAVNPRLTALIAHDRAGFGGVVFTAGLTAFGCLWCSPPSQALWETVLIAGTVSLASATWAHLAVGYTDPWHLAPVAAGVVALVSGLVLLFPAVCLGRS